jgi:site-specific DNA-methyltransferase (adenine-specific)
MKKKITLNNCELYCGDCFEILPTISQKIDAVISDPPFGNTSCDWDIPINLSEFWKVIKDKTKDNAVYVMFAVGKFTIDLINSNYNDFFYDLVWQKNYGLGFLRAKKQQLRSHEQIIIFCKKGQKIKSTYNPQMWQGKPVCRTIKGKYSKVYKKYIECDYINPSGMRYPLSVITIPKGNVDRNSPHSTCKPVELMDYLVKTYSNKNDVVCDPFMGSGTTGVSAVMGGRRFVGIEKNEEFFKLAVKRIKDSIKHQE